MDKLGTLIIQALQGYLKEKPSKKKTVKKKTAPAGQKKPEGIAMTQTVHVGHPSPMNEADVALGRMRKQPDWGLLKGD